MAYILNGIATRLAFSIGLNTESMHSSGRFQVEEARRTWWLIYVQEVELSLDSGRPMSIGTSDMDIQFPVSAVSLEWLLTLWRQVSHRVRQDGGDADVNQEMQVQFIRYLAEIAIIMRRVLKLVLSSLALPVPR